MEDDAKLEWLRGYMRALDDLKKELLENFYPNPEEGEWIESTALLLSVSVLTNLDEIWEER